MQLACLCLLQLPQDTLRLLGRPQAVHVEQHIAEDGVQIPNREVQEVPHLRVQDASCAGKYSMCIAQFDVITSSTNKQDALHSLMVMGYLQDAAHHELSRDATVAAFFTVDRSTG